MSKYLLIILLFFSQQTLAQCFYRQISSTYKNDFIWFNIIDKISQELENSVDKSVLSDNEIKTIFSSASSSTKEVCGYEDSSYYNIQPIQKIEWKKNLLKFSLNGKDYELQRSSQGAKVLWSYRRFIYGKFHNFMGIIYEGGALSSVKVIGRNAGEEDIQRYAFFFNKERNFEEKVKVGYLGVSSGDFKTLTSIYGLSYKKEMVNDPIIKVGIIGSGVDYNHPLVAKHLAFREGIEQDLLKQEALLKNLATKHYFSKNNYLKDLKVWEELNESTGFPSWMDQALHSLKPIDRVIPMMPGSSSEHETRMASRILRSGGDIQLYSVRKLYGYSMSEDYVEVIDEFAQNGVSIVNMSFAYSCKSVDPYKDQWEKVFSENKDMIFVVAAGNDGKNLSEESYCPAKYSQVYKNVISVTALGDEGLLASYNGTSVNYGPVDIAIKADNLEVLSPGSKWKNNSSGGSSVATAEVTRILVESVLGGQELEAQKAKEQLVQASVYQQHLKGVVLSKGELKEELF